MLPGEPDAARNPETTPGGRCWRGSQMLPGSRRCPEPTTPGEQMLAGEPRRRLEPGAGGASDTRGPEEAGGTPPTPP